LQTHRRRILKLAARLLNLFSDGPNSVFSLAANRGFVSDQSFPATDVTALLGSVAAAAGFVFLAVTFPPQRLQHHMGQQQRRPRAHK
jgi:hypothetical protein